MATPFSDSTAQQVNSPKATSKSKLFGGLFSSRKDSKDVTLKKSDTSYTKDAAIESLINKFQAGYFTGESIKYCTDDAMFNPPGAPPMTVSQLLDMIKPMSIAFPDWHSKCFGVEKNADGTYTVLTQQCIGGMKANLEAMGPFPPVALDSVPELAKSALSFPVEIGTYTLNADCTKIVSGTYGGATRDVGAVVTPEIEAMWNKKGDLSDVGFGAVFTIMGVSLPPPPPPTAAPTFFTVVHEFVEGKAEGWWSFLGGLSSADHAAMAAKWKAMGLANHAFLPTSPTGKINCLWEVQDPNMTAEAFQAFIDGPDGPGEGVFVNQVFRVMDGGMLPPSKLQGAAAEAAAAAPIASSGTFFWIYHNFKEGAAAPFWEMMASMTPESMAAMTAKWNTMGLHNHTFEPCGVEGPAICIWESEKPMSVEAFQAFIDGPDGPGAGAVFDNDVHAVMDGATLPSAKFPVADDEKDRLQTILESVGVRTEIREQLAAALLLWKHDEK